MTEKIVQVPVTSLKPAAYNPRKFSPQAHKDLTQSIQRFGMVDPIIANSAPSRKDIVIGGHFRLRVAKDLGLKTVPVLYICIPDPVKERELNLRLNKNLGEWDFEILADFDEKLLLDVGFTQDEMDNVLHLEIPEEFDVQKEIEKLRRQGAQRARIGDLWALGQHRLVVGDATDRRVWESVLGRDRFDFMFTDPPYKLAYTRRMRKVKTKAGAKLKQDKVYLSVGETEKGGKVKGFGLKGNRVYLGVERHGGVPEFEEWLSIAKDFQNSAGANVMVFENWRNLPELWAAIEKHWKIRNMVIWWLPNRAQGFSKPHSFFNKYDFALLGDKGSVAPNSGMEDEFQEFLEEKGSKLLEQHAVALYGQKGESVWFGERKKGKDAKGYYQRVKGTRWATVSDHVSLPAETAASSGQNLVFGTKPIPLLVPYIKILSSRNGIVMEPYGGSGSTMIACEIMKRQCRAIELEPLYAEIILARWERFTGKKAVKIHGEEKAKAA